MLRLLAVFLLLFPTLVIAQSSAWRQNPVLRIREGRTSDLLVEREVTKILGGNTARYQIQLTIYNRSVKGFINVFERFGEGVTLVETAYCPCVESEAGRELKFNWLHVPKGKSVKLSYTIQLPAGQAITDAISGGVLYHRTRALPSTGPFTARPRYLTTTPPAAQAGATPSAKGRLRKRKKVELPPL